MEPNVEYIKQLMEERDLSIRGLARIAGVSPTAISNYFQGKRGAGRVLIDGFMRAFPDVSLNKLFFLPNVSSFNDNKRKRRIK